VVLHVNLYLGDFRMTHSENNDILWASGRVPYAIAVKRELQAEGMDETDAIILIKENDGYVCNCMQRGRKPSQCAKDIKGT